ncbi:MAG: hypothetical protein KME12_19425 [Trichocoleus desertorum ATA4-8-CV12]|nr:hypothetical protein [Trichocoleus desertorum ATA4-8-CV12]
MGIVYNRSSRDVFVVGTDTGSAIAHVLGPGRRSPDNVDIDGVRGRYNQISGWDSWWKIPDPNLPDILDDGGNLKIVCSACFRVGDNQFGNITYNYDSGWGLSIANCLFTDILVDTMGLADDGSEMNALRSLREYLLTSNYGNSIVREYENASALYINSLSQDSEKSTIVAEIASPIAMEIVEQANKKDYQKAIDAWRKLRSSLEVKLQMLEY